MSPMGDQHNQFFDLAHNMDDFFSDIFDSLDDILAMDSCAICGVSFGLFNSYLSCDTCQEAVCFLCCGREKENGKLECNACVGKREMIWAKHHGADLLVPKGSILGEAVPEEHGGEGKKKKHKGYFGQDWACVTCGYINEGSLGHQLCFCCSSAKPVEPVGPDEPAATTSTNTDTEKKEEKTEKKKQKHLDKRKEEQKNWHCEKCLASNLPTATACKQCSAPVTSFTFSHWACPLCTFSNEHRDDQCFMCGSSRPSEGEELLHAEKVARSQLHLTGDIDISTRDLKTVGVLREEEPEDVLADWGSIFQEEDIFAPALADGQKVKRGSKPKGSRKTGHHRESVKDVLRPGGTSAAATAAVRLPTTGKPLTVGDPRKYTPPEGKADEPPSKWEIQRRAKMGIDKLPTEFLKVEMTLTYTSLRPKEAKRAVPVATVTVVTEDGKEAEQHKPAHDVTDDHSWKKAQEEARNMMRTWDAVHEEDFTEGIAHLWDEHAKSEAVRTVFAPAPKTEEEKKKEEIAKAKAEALVPVVENHPDAPAAPAAPAASETKVQEKKQEQGLKVAADASKRKTVIIGSGVSSKPSASSSSSAASPSTSSGSDAPKTVLLVTVEAVAEGEKVGGAAKGIPRKGIPKTKQPPTADKDNKATATKAVAASKPAPVMETKTITVVQPGGQKKEVQVEKRKEVGHTAVHEEAMQKDMLALLGGDKTRYAAFEKESQNYGRGKSPAYAYYYFLGKTFGDANIPLILPNLLKALGAHPKQQEALRMYHQHALSRKCGKCQKIVYVPEQEKGAGLNWHRWCFKCMHDGCDITLTQSTVEPHHGKIYCSKHKPMSKAKPWARKKTIG
eukprot:gb/GEZN01001280.1/.p1 GENE.gb/GEZN01001280.1/~~gb/GEZN01001280.1/.p1  ORF type:complete len:887 (-),score=189.56 gb/GEZN01001280.1/:510-3038(-)